MKFKEVFISYKAEEKLEAEWVKSVLEKNGISCWMAPECMPGGSNYATEIPQAIKNCKVFVLILSAKAQSSRWISREVDLAINESKIVLPFMLENCNLQDDFNFYLTNIQRYTAYENKVAAIEKMLCEIKALINKDTDSSNNIVFDSVGNTRIIDNSDSSKKKYDIKSVCSFIFGIVAVIAMFGVLLFPNVIAVILSFLGLNSIKMNNTAGKGFALGGQILGLITLCVGMYLVSGALGCILTLIVDVISFIIFIKKYKSLD